jgi:hypothetical protein
VDAAVQAEAAERIVEVRGIARQHHAAMAPFARHALVDAVDALVADFIVRLFRQETLHARLHRARREQVVVGQARVAGKRQPP